MNLYNAKTRQIEALNIHDNRLSIYVCGITPYDTTHLGHAFTYAAYDVLIRYLEMGAVRVHYAQNVTDIDDDILKRANQTGDNWRELGNRWTNHFIDDMIALNVRPPDDYPRATEVIPEIITTVQALLADGLAYQQAGNVYYAVARYPAFGQLSHLPKEEMLPIANERGNRPDDPNKRNPIDFVLWQAQAPGEPAWDSPWGPGRPGWHIECSTMATKFLGSPVDVHGGGLDLCFPHHECEIAQSQPLLGDAPYVRCWMHTAMVGYLGEKMSKSLGNLVMISDLLKTYSPDALRLYLGSHHYRTAWSYEQADLDSAAAQAERLRQAAADTTMDPANAVSLADLTAFEHAFTQAMEDDLQTPAALQALIGLGEDLLAGRYAGQDAQAARAALVRYGGVFGLRLGQDAPEERVQAGWQAHRSA